MRVGWVEAGVTDEPERDLTSSDGVLKGLGSEWLVYSDAGAVRQTRKSSIASISRSKLS